MSVMCSVFVPEGIVMAAESRQVVGIMQGVQAQQKAQSDTRVLNRMQQPGTKAPIPMFTLSDNAQKLMLLSKVKVGVSACGIGLLEGKTISDYIRTFENQVVAPSDTVTAVARKLHEYAYKHFPQINFFVCGYDEDEPFVYSINKEIKRSNNENGKMRYASVWSGEQLAITKLLNGQPPMIVNHALMPLKDAIDFAEFLVDLTIKYQRFEMKLQTCGGDIDILVLTKDDSFWYRHKILKPGR